MSFLMRSVFCGVLSLSPLVLYAIEITVDSIKPFTSLCVGENSTGFNWIEGKWVRTNFKPEKYLLQKINYEKEMLSPNFNDQPLLCNKPSLQTYSSSGWAFVKACYVFRPFGTPLSMLTDAKQCLETFRNGSLDNINCEGIGLFKPNGLFVKLPSYISMDLRSSTSKDSMALEVGICSAL